MFALIALPSCFFILLWPTSVTHTTARTTKARHADFPVAIPLGRRKFVSFRGVSFSYDSALAANVRATVPRKTLDGKPGDIWPDHVIFLVRYQKTKLRGEDHSEEIRVFRIAEYRKTMMEYTKQEAAITQPPANWMPHFEDQVRTLKATLIAGPAGANLRQLKFRPS